MLRWVVTASVLAGAAPAAAEDWWHIGTMGDAPTRQTGMFDFDSIDWTDPAIPRFMLAVLSETPDEFGTTLRIATQAFDCDAATTRNEFIEVYNDEGYLTESSPLDQPFEPIIPGTFYDNVRLAVCEDQWQWPGGFQFGKGKTLSQIEGEVFAN